MIAVHDMQNFDERLARAGELCRVIAGLDARYRSGLVLATVAMSRKPVARHSLDTSAGEARRVLAGMGIAA